VIDVGECVLFGVGALGKFNVNYKKVLSVKEVFSKSLHLVTLRSTTGIAVPSAFQSIFEDSSRLSVWVRTDKDKEFLNRHFQETLKSEGIEFQVCKNPDVKCSVVESAHRKIRDRMYKYFTYKNTYRYIDVLPKFVRAHNDTATGIAIMTDSDVLAVWKRMEARRRGVRVAKATICVGQHIRISREKMKFDNGTEQNFSTLIFRIAKVIEMRP